MIHPSNEEPMTLETLVTKISTLSRELEAKAMLHKLIITSGLGKPSINKVEEEMLTILEDLIKRSVVLKNSIEL